jgi:GNAT superfamily N-acetyltransferase
MSLGPFAPYARDLAPGDRGSLDADWDGYSVVRIDSASHPLFADTYDRLWREFGERGEMERRDVIVDRLAWDPRRPFVDQALLYEMIVVRHGDRTVAVRDHSVVVPVQTFLEEPGEIVVHLSHVLVEPDMRGRGLASWLRAIPVETARRAFSIAKDATPSVAAMPPVTLVAEMETSAEDMDAVRRRLRSYARAGFRMVSPSLVTYYQPDFRAAEEIAASSPRPLEMFLVMRRVGREHENTIHRRDLSAIAMALHSMFAVHVRADHLPNFGHPLLFDPNGLDDVPLVIPGVPPPEDRTVIK